MLAHDTTGSGPRIVLLHGFAQTRRCWAPLDAALAATHEVVRIDLPGHGGSAAVAADVGLGADLAAEVGGRAVYVGYSMGGRHLLHLAVRHPDLVQGLVLIGATAGIEDPAERAERRQRDHALAARVEQVGVERFVEEWLAQPLFDGLAPPARFTEERAANTPEGLAASLRLAGTGAMPPVWDRLGEVRAPAVVMAGARDATYRALAQRLAAGLGGPAEVVAVDGAGHAAHLERPDTVVDVVTSLAARRLD